MEDADAQDRRDLLMFSGEGLPLSTVGENCISLLCNLIRDKLKLNVAPSDISASYRMGTKSTVQGPDRRILVMKLCRRDRKWDLLIATLEIKPNFYLNENLTPTKNKILYALHVIRRRCGDTVGGCSSSDRNVYAWLKASHSA